MLTTRSVPDIFAIDINKDMTDQFFLILSSRKWLNALTIKSDSDITGTWVLLLMEALFKTPAMFNFVLSFSQGRLAATVFEESTCMRFLFTKALAESYTEIYTTI